MKFPTLAFLSVVTICYPALANAQGQVRSVGGQNVDLALPAGFCVPDMDNAADATFVKGLATLLKNSNNILVQAFLSCEDQKRRRASAAANIYDYISYYYPLVAEKAVIPDSNREAARKELCDEIRKTRLDTKQVERDVAKSAEELRRNMAVNNIKELGVLAEDAHGCYSGLLAAVSAGKENNYLVNANIVGTIVRGKYLFFGLYSKYADAEGSAKSLQTAQSLAAELDRKNPSPAR